MSNSSGTAAWSPSTPLSRLLAAAQLTIRWREWYASKIPFVWIGCAAAALTSSSPPDEIVRHAATAVLFACLCGAFGHIANDFADRECDEAAGRRTPAGQMTAAQVGAILLLLAGVALAAVAPLAASPVAVAAGIASLVFGAAYSLPPLRLKSRGLAGIFGAAAAQRTFPMLVGIAAIHSIDLPAALLLGVAQLAGMRWMLVHQIVDAESDRSSGVATWVSVVGEPRALAALRRVVLPLEILLLVLALLLEATATPLLWLVPAAGLLTSGAWLLRCRGVQAPYSLDGYARQPLAGFYLVVWPLGLSVALAVSHPRMWIVAAAFVVWQHRYIRHKLAQWIQLRERRGISPA